MVRVNHRLTGSGRLAPTLLEDLTLYDPAQPGRPNVLRENPFDFADGLHLGDQIPPGGCRHDFWLKPRQSEVPELDEEPSADTRWRVAAMCGRCRVHLTLDVDFTIRWLPGPCPNDKHHLHHLVHSEWRENLERKKWEEANPGQAAESCSFDCSSHTCGAFVTVRFTPPEIDHETITTLVDKEKLRERTEAAFTTNQGNTQGMKQPLPIDVLSDLRIYVKNAWDEEPSHRSVKLSNRRFIVRFGPNGDACKEALESLGFELDLVS
jgi:ubiquitin carboxyl-terminal hydrolase 25